MIKLLAACGRNSTLRDVALEFGIHTSTVARRLDTLENQLGYRIVERRPDGIEYTDAGRKLAPKALEIERSIFAFSRDALTEFGNNINKITIQAPEGLGTHWISKHYEKHKDTTNVRLEIVCSDTLPDLGMSRVDISVQYQATANSDYVQFILGHLNILPFASQDYIAKYGAPNSADELKQHRLIAQIGPHDTVDLWRSNFKGEVLKELEPNIFLSTDSGSAQYSAICGSMGIGGLPTYGAAEYKNLVPLEIGIQQSVPIYMVYRKDGVRNRTMFSRAVRWTKAIFDPRKHHSFSGT